MNLSSWLYKITAGMPCRLIPNDSGPYLERYYVGRVFGWTFYLHRFVSSDVERHLHNHPWRRGFALVLCGGYVEEYAVDVMPWLNTSGMLTDTRRVRWFNRIDHNHVHRIKDAMPNTWTLFARGPTMRVRRGCASLRKGWGFFEAAKLDDGTPATVYKQFESAGQNWHLTAPKGRDAGREPYVKA